MLTFFGENDSGSFPLPRMIYVEINSELDVPADDLTVRFLGGCNRTLHRIYAVRGKENSLEAAKKNGRLEFIGIVDEQIYKNIGGVKYTEIYARSMAALPLDSECEAGIYRAVGIDVLYRRHLEKFGISKEFADETASGRLSLPSGISHYNAVKSFCGNYLKTKMRIDALGRFRTDAYRPDPPILFGKNGIPYSNLTVRFNRYSTVSRVIVSTGNGEITVKNDSKAAVGVTRERRINLQNSATGTLGDADLIIKKSNDNSMTAELTCGKYLGDIIGRGAEADDEFTAGKRLIVTKTKYTAKDGEERCSVKFAIREE